MARIELDTLLLEVVLLGAARQRARGQRTRLGRATAGNRAAPDAQRASGCGAYHVGRAGVTGEQLR